MINYNKTQDSFFELIAKNLDIKDQVADGVHLSNLDHDRYIDRYNATGIFGRGELSVNVFRHEVDYMVGALLNSIDEDN